MKKIASILLLLILLFNLAGYSFLFQYLIQKADTNMVKQLDATAYNESDLREVKVPLNMPYITDTKEFERVDGQLEYGGIHYNYVKRKVANDTLYLLYLPNVSKTALYNAKADYSKEVNDVPVSKKSADAIKKISFGNDYNVVTNGHKISTLLAAKIINPDIPSVHLPHTIKSIPEQPPQAVSC